VFAHPGTSQASNVTVPSLGGVGGWAARAGAGSNTLIPPGFLIFSKEFEAEADRLALDYLAKCRYRAASLVEFFESLGPVAKSFESHPMTKERIAAAQRLLTQLGNRPDAIATTQEFEDMKARLVR